jgi:hypothetical protein
VSSADCSASNSLQRRPRSSHSAYRSCHRQARERRAYKVWGGLACPRREDQVHDSVGTSQETGLAWLCSQDDCRTSNRTLRGSLRKAAQIEAHEQQKWVWACRKWLSSHGLQDPLVYDFFTQSKQRKFFLQFGPAH